MNRFATLLLASASTLALALTGGAALAQSKSGSGGAGAGGVAGGQGTVFGANNGGTDLANGSGGGSGGGPDQDGGGGGGIGIAAGGSSGSDGSLATPNGTNGASGSPAAFTKDGAGGGGGGGFGLNISTGNQTLSSLTITGGGGGSGGAGGSTGGGGGGGGEGAAGIFTSTTTGALTLTGTSVTGGTGGNGGNGGGGGHAGNGGDGGEGIFLDAGGGAGVVVDSASSISGGNGGTGGTGGTPGAGGVGILGDSFTLDTAGSISGGLSGDGVTRASALQLTGTNIVTLENGFSFTGNIALISGTTTFNQSSVQTLGTVITGGGGLIDSGTGALTLAGANTYSGGTTIGTGATLVQGVDTNGAPGAITSSAFGTGTLTFDGGTLQAGGAGFTVANAVAINATGGTINQNAHAVTFSGVIANGSGTPAGLLNISDNPGDASLVTLTGANTYSGGTNITGGTVQISNSTIVGGVVQSSSLGTGAITLNSSSSGLFSTPNAIIQATASLTLGNAVVLGAAGGEIDANGNVLTISGNISGGGPLTVGSASGTVVLSGNNTYTGATAITAGMLKAGSATALGVNSQVSMADNTTLDLAGFSESIGSLNDIVGFPPAPATGDVITNSGVSAVTLTIGGSTPSSVFDGLIQDGTGGIALNKVGTDIQTLGGANTYSHGTTLTGGVIKVAVDTVGTPGAVTSSAIGTGTLNFNGGTLQAGGNFTIANAGQVQSGGGAIDANGFNLTYSAVIASAASPGALTIESGGGTGTVTFTGINTYAAGTVIASGATLALSGSGAIAASSGVADAGTFDISATSGASIKSLSGAGGVTLGAEPLTITAGTALANDFSGDISGTGAVSITGGTEIFSAAQDYSGATTIGSGATLQLGDGGTGGSLTASSIGTDNGTLAYDHSDNVTLGVALSGAGGVTQLGSGTLTVTANQAYTGATTVSAGTLQIGNGGTTGSVAGNITDNATLVFDRSDPLTYAGVISGTGTATQEGAGTLTLTGTNTLSGTFTINSASTLALSGGGSLAGAAINDAGIFDISATTTGASIRSLAGAGTVAMGSKTFTITTGAGTFTGAITGSGPVTIAGGSEVFASNQTYTGSTTVASGATLQLGNGGTAGAVSGALVDNGTVVFNHINNPSYAGVISGSGGLTQSGTGVLTIAAAQTYTGATTVSSGSSLVIGDGATSGSIAGNLVVNGIAAFNRSDAVTYAGVISGSGAFAQNGSGNLNLTGTSTFNGAVKVNAGTLSVNGTLPGTVTVISGAKLGGNGTVGAVTVNSGGTVAPGNSIGTLHVSGNLTLASGSTYAVEVSPSAADEIIATGAASIGGTLALNPAAGTYTAGTDYTLISASSVTGTFASVTGASFGGLNSTVQYSATKVDLILSSTAVAPTTFAFGTFGATPNAVAAGTAISVGSTTATLYTQLGAQVASNAAAVPGALVQLAGDIHASLRSAAIEDSRIIRDAVLDHVHQAGDGMSAWAQGWGGTGTLTGKGNAGTLNHNTSGVIAGIDAPLAPGLRLGVAGAYSGSTDSVHGQAAGATGESGHVIGYANWAADMLDLSIGGDYGWGSNQVTRHVTALSETDRDHQSSKAAQAFGEVGYKIQNDAWMIEPHANIAWVQATTGAFAEAGGAGALSGAEKSGSETYGLLGIRAMLGSLNLGGASLVPKIDLGWQHAFTSFTPMQALSFSSVNQSFSVAGVPLGSDSALVQVGLALQLSPDAQLSLSYDGNFSSRVEEHAVEAGLKIAF